MNYIWPKAPTTWMEGRAKCISIPFTWDLPEVRRSLLFERDLGMWDRVIVGGPAVYLMPEFFTDLDFVAIGRDAPGVLQRVNALATRTTTGCVRRCQFCGVKIIEPEWSELPDWPDQPVLADNNLLAASPEHFDRVMDRLERHGWADFTQGLDSRLLTDHHAERIARLRDPRTRVRLALDHMSYADDWQAALERLVRAGVSKKLIYSYALVGFRDSPEEAWKRCDFIKRQGVSVLAMRFHPLDALARNVITQEQRDLGWDDDEFKHLMGFYWRRRGQKPAYLAA